VNGIAVPLENVIKEATSYGLDNLHRDLVSLREAVLLAKDSIGASIEAADRNGAEREIERTYEAGSQPATSCALSEMGAGLQLGNITREKVLSDILERMAERGKRHARTLDYAEELLDPHWPGPERAAALLGTGLSPATLTVDETAEMEKLLESLSDPNPLAELTEAQKKTPSGKIHETMKKDFETRKTLYRGILARNAMGKVPTMTGLEDFVKGKWEDMGGQGPPPGLTDGKISEETLFWYLANMRLASANWHEETLPTLPEAGLLRELVSMQAISLELLRRQNLNLETLNNLLALEALQNLDAAKSEGIRLQYNRTVSRAND
jgi:hypothetical protein